MTCLEYFKKGEKSHVLKGPSLLLFLSISSQNNFIFGLVVLDSLVVWSIDKVVRFCTTYQTFF